VVAAVDRLAPFEGAEPWDNVGLLLGDAAAPARRILVCLDVGEAVCQEADRIGADVVLAHHPLLFKEFRRLTSETRAGRLALRLATSGRACIAAHTNLDAAPGGLCDQLAWKVGLAQVGPLASEGRERRHKVVVFVPEGDLAAVQAAAFEAGAGCIGRYSECSFAAAGTGTFHPGEGAAPAAGARGTRSGVAEYRLEFIADRPRLGAILAAVARAHSYEEPAIDVYVLEPGPATAGVGRVGRLKKAKTAAEFAEVVKGALGRQAVEVAGRRDRRIERVALVTGSGSGLVESVLAANVDCYLTGELKFHEVQELEAAGVAVILGGHYETERVPLDAWTPRLAEIVDAEVVLSESERSVLSVE
jgi:dinuclear metal center YbgI/SA1388 family protein